MRIWRRTFKTGSRTFLGFRSSSAPVSNGISSYKCLLNLVSFLIFCSSSLATDQNSLVKPQFSLEALRSLALSIKEKSSKSELDRPEFCDKSPITFAHLLCADISPHQKTLLLKELALDADLPSNLLSHVSWIALEAAFDSEDFSGVQAILSLRARGNLDSPPSREISYMRAWADFASSSNKDELKGDLEKILSELQPHEYVQYSHVIRDLVKLSWPFTPLPPTLVAAMSTPVIQDLVIKTIKDEFLNLNTRNQKFPQHVLNYFVEGEYKTSLVHRVLEEPTAASYESCQRIFLTEQVPSGLIRSRFWTTHLGNCLRTRSPLDAKRFQNLLLQNQINLEDSKPWLQFLAQGKSFAKRPKQSLNADSHLICSFLQEKLQGQSTRIELSDENWKFILTQLPDCPGKWDYLAQIQSLDDFLSRNPTWLPNTDLLSNTPLGPPHFFAIGRWIKLNISPQALLSEVSISWLQERWQILTPYAAETIRILLAQDPVKFSESYVASQSDFFTKDESISLFLPLLWNQDQQVLRNLGLQNLIAFRETLRNLPAFAKLENTPAFLAKTPAFLDYHAHLSLLQKILNAPIRKPQQLLQVLRQWPSLSSEDFREYPEFRSHLLRSQKEVISRLQLQLEKNPDISPTISKFFLEKISISEASQL